MKLHHLRGFVAIAQTRSVRGAARKPAASHLATLFERAAGHYSARSD
ncbi:hypothetical protein [Cupriavidus sp. YAF13]